MKTIVPLSIATVLATASIQFSQQAVPSPSGSFAVEHVTVINVETATRTPDQTVVVTSNKITAVGPSAKTKVPAGARIVDGKGKFLIPGIWDMHMHDLRWMDRTLPVVVQYGVTGIRDMGSSLENVAEARTRVAKGEILSPRFLAAGPPLDGEPVRPGFPPAQMVSSPEEGRQIVDKLAAAKVNVIKIHNGLSRETYFAIAAAAKAKGLPFEGHLPPEVDFNEASDTGQRTVEHMGALQDLCAKDKSQLRLQRGEPAQTQPIEIDQAKCEATIKHIVKNGTWWTPTISSPSAGGQRVRDFNLKITNMAYKGGVKILAGTDWPGLAYQLRNYEGIARSVMDELIEFVEAGLTPQDALKTAITNPVILLKLKDQLGTIERGKLADLDLLDGDPLADIANVKRISAVVVNGRFVDAAERQKIMDAETAARKAAPKSSN